MTIGEVLNWAEKFLNQLPAARLEAEVLLSHITGHNRSRLLARPDQPLSPLALARFAWLIYRRNQGLPSAYLTRRAEFFGQTFMVNNKVLIPRPETETLVEVASEIIKHESVQKVIELGTGSGCVILCLSNLHPTLEFIGTDISLAALKLAKKNALKLNHRNIKWLHGNLLSPVISELSKEVIVVANLPYLTPAEINGELKYEPAIALNGGQDGLAVYSALFAQLAQLPPGLRPGYLILEIHPPSLANLRILMTRYLHMATFKIAKDLASRPRVITLKLA